MNVIERIMQSDYNTTKPMHTVGELTLLQTLGRDSIGPVINLGCYRGASAAALASACTHPAYSVDKYYDFGPRPDGGHNLVRWLHRKSFMQSEEAARELWVRIGVNITQCVGTTDEWAVKLKDVRFGVVFIDADHQYESCKADYENWRPLVMPGGVIAFHDNNQTLVKDVLRDCVKLEKLYEVERTTVYRA